MPSLPRSVVRLYGYFQPQGSHAARIRPASSRGDSSHDDASGAEERNFGAGVECRLAVVRAILGELSPGRCDGAPRGLEASSRDRACTTTCGTFVLGLGTSPGDAQRAGWARALILGPRLLWHRRAWRHTKRTKQGPFGFSEAPAICAQPCATDQIAKRRAALLQRPKAAASNFAWPCAGR